MGVNRRKVEISQPTILSDLDACLHNEGLWIFLYMRRLPGQLLSFQVFHVTAQHQIATKYSPSKIKIPLALSPYWMGAFKKPALHTFKSI